jgi:hypothetical protein
MSEDAKFIAKATINNCFGSNCRVNGMPLNPPSFMLPPENKIFPQEIDNAGEYLKNLNDSYNKTG